jgi:diadenosine tetraphosphate (Ap4A) HIT family hydrolase
MNATIVRFGYPASLLHEYGSWVVLLRPAQPTLGSMILACKEGATALAAVSAQAWSELAVVTGDLERALRATLDHEKINYLALMMVDPHVHFHVIPRYSTSREFEGSSFADSAWPKPPDVTSSLGLSPAQMAALHAALKSAWPQH